MVCTTLASKSRGLGERAWYVLEVAEMTLRVERVMRELHFDSEGWCCCRGRSRESRREMQAIIGSSTSVLWSFKLLFFTDMSLSY